MKKALLYPGLGMILGLALVLIPLITVAGFETNYGGSQSMADLPKSMRSLEGTAYYSDSKEYSGDLESFSVSFVIALGAYVLFKRKTPRRRYRFMGPYPF